MPPRHSTMHGYPAPLISSCLVINLQSFKEVPNDQCYLLQQGHDAAFCWPDVQKQILHGGTDDQVWDEIGYQQGMGSHTWPLLQTICTVQGIRQQLHCQQRIWERRHHVGRLLQPHHCNDQEQRWFHLTQPLHWEPWGVTSSGPQLRDQCPHNGTCPDTCCWSFGHSVSWHGSTMQTVWPPTQANFALVATFAKASATTNPGNGTTPKSRRTGCKHLQAQLKECPNYRRCAPTSQPIVSPWH